MRRPTLRSAALWILCAAAAAWAQSPDPGHATYVETAGSNLNAYTSAPGVQLQQWILNHFSAMIAYPPYFDPNLLWYPHAYAYYDLYGIQQGSWEQTVHPEWILHDANGNWLYVPYGCSGGSCALYAGDIANPAFRAAWISHVAGLVNQSKYPGVFIDDVNMEFRVSNGNGTPVTPIDSNTGQPMTSEAWRNYVAGFMEQIRAAIPNAKLMENTIWYAGPAGVQDADPAIQRQIATADTISLERGVASDPGLTGGTGFWSVYSFLNYVDRVHNAGKAVDFREYGLDPAGQQYGLASYFLISNGEDTIGDLTTTPDSWWHGYDTDLGIPLGARTYNNGIFERDFEGGKVLLGEPGLSPRQVALGGTYTTLDGVTVNSVTIGGSQGLILLASDPPSAIFSAASLEGGSISPGEIVALTGSFSGGSPAVLFNGMTAPLTYAGPNRLNAIVPFGLDVSGPVEVEVQQAGQSNQQTSVLAVPASPAIFTQNGTGIGPGAILNQDYSVNSAANPAAPGSVIMIYGTGFGTLNPLPADGQIVHGAPLTTAVVTATIGGLPAQVLYAGGAPDLIAGVAQVNVQVPQGVQANSAALVVLTIDSRSTQLGVTLSVQ